MTKSPVPPPGGHLLESVFGAVSEPSPESTAKAHHRHTRLLLPLLGVVAVGAACAITQWSANVGYDTALVEFERGIEGAEVGRAYLGAELIAIGEITDAAALVAESDSGNLMPVAAMADFSAAADEAMNAEAHASSLTEQTLPAAGQKPWWAWELFGETARLSADLDVADDAREEFQTTTTALADVGGALDQIGADAMFSAAEAAEAFEAAHVSARNVDIIALRQAASRLADAGALDATAAEMYIDLEAAASQVLTSEQAEIAEKQGQLYDSRVEIEAFARGLAPGVLLDFDWSPLVNGYGESDSMGGYATWWYSDPGYANIELSDSVARHWPGDRSKALVAHEVGHAISVKCEGMYDDSTQENIEAWATAWAISMGFHDVANGTSAYGTPPQELIDAASGCR